MCLSLGARTEAAVLVVAQGGGRIGWAVKLAVPGWLAGCSVGGVWRGHIGNRIVLYNHFEN